MPNEEGGKPKRKRVIVEEVNNNRVSVETPSSEAPLEEIKEKAQEIEKLAEEVEKTEVSIDNQVTNKLDIEPIPMQDSPSPLVIIIPGIFLLGGLLGGILFYQNKVSNNQVSASPTPVATETATADSTPSPKPKEVDKKKYEINILNGSGIGGEAGRAEDHLVEVGYKVSGTGNATSYDFTKSVIQAKSTVDRDFLDMLSKDLGKKYEVDAKIKSLSSSSKDEIVVTVGSSKK